MTRLRARIGLGVWSSPYAGQHRSSPTTVTQVRSTSTGSPAYRPDPRWPRWKPTVGLELHVQLKGNPKLFSRAYLPNSETFPSLR